MINGVGPEAPIVADERGYKTSETPYRMDLMPGAALLHLSHIMKYGAEGHGEDNWRKGTVRDHINKALIHLFAYLDDDTQDDHLGHAAWRTMAALEIQLKPPAQPRCSNVAVGHNCSWRAVCCVGDGCETTVLVCTPRPDYRFYCAKHCVASSNGATRCVA